MQLTWIPERRRFVGTQTEAKAEKSAFEVVDVPTIKPELIEYLNAREARAEAELQELRDEIEALRARVADAEADQEAHEPEEVTTPTAVPVAGSRFDLVEAVLDLDAARLAPVLSAAIGRLGEIGGIHGWAAFGKSTYAWSPGAKSVEQGMGMLMLAAFDTFATQTAEKPTRQKARQPRAGDEE